MNTDKSDTNLQICIHFSTCDVCFCEWHDASHKFTSDCIRMWTILFLLIILYWYTENNQQVDLLVASKKDKQIMLYTSCDEVCYQFWTNDYNENNISSFKHGVVYLMNCQYCCAAIFMLSIAYLSILLWCCCCSQLVDWYVNVFCCSIFRCWAWNSSDKKFVWWQTIEISASYIIYIYFSSELQLIISK